MLTFLPFLRAVKAPARSIGVCALFGLAPLLSASSSGCARGETVHALPGPATGPQPAFTANSATSAGLHTELPPDAGAAVATGGALAASSGAPLLQLDIDLPYPVDARPRSANPMQAAAEDEELARWNLGGSADPSSPSSNASYHPGTRVVVDTRQAKLRPGAVRGPAPRGLTLARVQATARSRGYWPFRLCFEAGQRQKKSDGGETRVAFTIGTHGHVRAARLLDSHLGNPSSAACLVREVLKLEFSPRPPRAMAMVASIKIWPGDAELPSAPEPSAVSLPPGGAFDPVAMRARVLDKRVALEACFSDARRADPKLWGRLALSVILEMDGSVHRVSEVESHFPSSTATRCAQILLSSVLFPSVDGKPFTFVVPLRLSPDKNANATQPSPEEDPSPAEGTSDDAGVD
ncbi:MAG: hypothetical protein ABUL62_00505 [Myxococcales bacterium]